MSEVKEGKGGGRAPKSSDEKPPKATTSYYPALLEARSFSIIPPEPSGATWVPD